MTQAIIGPVGAPPPKKKNSTALLELGIFWVSAVMATAMTGLGLVW